MVTFTTCVKCKSTKHGDEESSDEELSDDDVTEASKLTYFKWK